MKRTILLIIFLFLIAVSLIIAAIILPKTIINNKNAVTEIMTPTPTPAADTKLYFSPDTLVITNPASVEATIKVDTGYNKINAVQLEIGYDPKVFSQVALSPGDFFPTPQILLNLNDKKNGRLSYNLTLPKQTPYIKGEGSLAILTLNKNIQYNESSQSAITILPKSMITSSDVQGSLLKNSQELTIILSNK